MEEISDEMKSQRRRRRRHRPSCTGTSCRSSPAVADARPTTESTARRKRPRRRVEVEANAASSRLALLSCYYLTKRRYFNPVSVHAGVVTWSNGPEDRYFCGRSFDDPLDCPYRQNCRSGRDEDCEGHETHGIKCFAESSCDVKFGGAAAWSPGFYDDGGFPTSSPNVIDFEALVQGGLFVPTESPLDPGSPTPFPTDMPIRPPPDFNGPSENPTDHWYCGVGILDASERCETHCPTSSECAMHEICYFGTTCDARTHAPTPPPTRRPTAAPTTAEPTVSRDPTYQPTTSRPPTISPTMSRPTLFPTSAPAGRPTPAPLNAVQLGFFCGTSWSDVTSLCKRRCASGEDTDCPGDETCFAYTGCTEEHGYGSDPSKWIPGYDQWGNSIAEIVSQLKSEEEASAAAAGGRPAGDGGGAYALEEAEEALCKLTKVTVTADNWPQEISWTIADAETGNAVVTGDNNDLDPGTPISKTSCLPSWACYSFIIEDAGGDGLCCEHGEGNYRVDYDGETILAGGLFGDSESVDFGCETDEPTPRPTKKRTDAPVASNGGKSNSANNGSLGPSNSLFRCVANPLVEAGYIVAARFCNRFADCYNEHIGVGDDWFCKEGETCIAADTCGGSEGAESDAKTEEIEETATKTETSSKPRPAPEAQESAETISRPRPSPMVASVAAPPTRRPATHKPTKQPVTMAPTSTAPTGKPTTASPTGSPSETPTESPTLGPCGGNPCAESTHCRSRYGFCGPGKYYCTENAIWTSDCPAKGPMTPAVKPTPSPAKPTPSPVKSAPSPSGTQSIVDMSFPSSSDASSAEVVTSNPTIILPVPVPIVVTFVKPSGGKGKPSGGKGGSSGGKGKGSVSSGGGKGSFLGSKPSGVKPDSEPYIPVLQTLVPTSKPTKRATTNPPTSMPTTIRPTSKPTINPTRRPTPKPMEAQDPSYAILSTDQSDWVVITNAPTPRPTKAAVIQTNSESATVTSKTSTVEKTTPGGGGEINKGSMSTAASTAAKTPQEANEHSCTADPCEDETWCRSRYGSCGPGFIYCNSHSTWKASCPPMAPRPTRTPTPRPTRDPVTVSPAFSTLYSGYAHDVSSLTEVASSVPSRAPFLRKLPKPTLPTITKTSFAAQSYARPHSANDSTEIFPDEDEGRSISELGEDTFEKSEEEEIEHEKKGDEEPDATKPREQEYTGMNQWLDFTRGRSGGMVRHCAYSLGNPSGIFHVLVAPTLFWWMLMP